MLDKMGGIFAPRPSTGPHKLRESIPLILLIRNRLKYALTRKEAQMICMQKQVSVDGKVRTDMNFPAGFMDVVQIPKTKDQFRLLFDTKGRFTLHGVSDGEAKFKLGRVVNHGTTSKHTPYVVTHDGRTFRFPDPSIKVNDTVKIDLAAGKIVGHVKFETGTLAMITKGRNTGRVGTITNIERHPGSFDIVRVRDSTGAVFATRLSNAFVVGKGETSMVSLPKGKGVKKSIIEQRDALLKGK